MLTEAEIFALPQPLVEHFQNLERYVVTSVSKHVANIGELTATDMHRLDELQRIGYNLDKIQSEIAESIGKSEQSMRDIFAKASQVEYEDTKHLYDFSGARYIPFNENERLQELISQISHATYSTFVNISRTTGFVASGQLKVGGGFLPLSEYYQRIVDYAILQVRTGQVDFHSAMRSSLRTMAGNGLSFVDYESGHRRRLDSALRMNMLGGMAQLSHAQAEMIGRGFGADGYEITWHSGFRPTHDFGGKQFSEQEYATDILPLMQEPNCYHRSFPIIMGISTPAHSRQQLQELNKAEQELSYFEHRGYNAFDARQKQRRYEAAIRRQKDYINAFDASGDKEALQNAKIKLRRLNSSYKDFSKAMELSTHPKRTTAMPR